MPPAMTVRIHAYFVSLFMRLRIENSGIFSEREFVFFMMIKIYL